MNTEVSSYATLVSYCHSSSSSALSCGIRVRSSVISAWRMSRSCSWDICGGVGGRGCARGMSMSMSSDEGFAVAGAGSGGWMFCRAD